MKPSPPSDREIARAEVAPWAPNEAAEVAFLAGAAGVESYVEDAGCSQRVQVLRWMDHGFRTRTGKSRRARVANCGMLMVARQGDVLGCAHRWCRDAMCPGCMKRRQAKLSKFLQAYTTARTDAGAVVLFVTLTQPKRAVQQEGCKTARKRLQASRRRTFNLKTKAGRELRESIVGGVFFTESVWSYRGKANADGSKVAFSGWHAHLHGLVELAPPPAGIGPKQWVNMCRARLIDAWLMECPGASRDAQRIDAVRPEQVGQVCKYPLKPFGIANLGRQREACSAMVSGRMSDAFGSWRSWVKEGERIVDDAREGVASAPVEMGDLSVAYLSKRARWGGRVRFHKPDGTSDHVGVPAVDALAAIVANPSSFQRRAQEARRVAAELRAEQQLAQRDRGPP